MDMFLLVGSLIMIWGLLGSHTHIFSLSLSFFLSLFFSLSLSACENICIYVHICQYMYIFIGKVVFTKPSSPTISFWQTQLMGPVFKLGGFCGASPCGCSRTGLSPGWPTWRASIIDACLVAPSFMPQEQQDRRSMKACLDDRHQWAPVLLLLHSCASCGSFIDARLVARSLMGVRPCLHAFIDGRSAMPLACDLAAISDEGLWSLAFSPSSCNQKITMRPNHFVLDRFVSRIRKKTRCL